MKRLAIKKHFNSKKIKILKIREKILNGKARNIGVKKSNKNSDLISFVIGRFVETLKL